MLRASQNIFQTNLKGKKTTEMADSNKDQVENFISSFIALAYLALAAYCAAILFLRIQRRRRVAKQQLADAATAAARSRTSIRRCIRARAHLRQPRLLLEPCFICVRGDQLAAVRYRRVCHTRLLAHIRTHVGRYRNRLLFPRHRRVRRPAPAHHHRRILCCDP